MQSPAQRHLRVTGLLALCCMTFFSLIYEYGFPAREINTECVRTSLN